MSTEQPESGSEVSDRLANFFAPAPEVAEAEEEAAPEIETSADVEDEESEVQDEPDSEYVEIEVDGETFKAPQKLKDAVERSKDYTVKTQQLSTMRKAVEDKAAYVEAREQLMSQLDGELSEYRALQAQQKQYETLDWNALYNANPGQAMQLRDQRDDIARQLQVKEQAIRGKTQHMQAAQSQHLDKQWTLATEGAKQRIGKLTPAEDLAMANQVKALGFEDGEFKSKLADSRILHAIYKAAKWDELQSNKGTALLSATKAPPVIKPGATSNTPAASKDKSIRQRLKSSGDYRDAARLLMNRIK